MKIKHLILKHLTPQDWSISFSKRYLEFQHSVVSNFPRTQSVCRRKPSKIISAACLSK